MVCIISMDCPLCGQTHEVELRKRNTTALIKRELVEYEESYYCCRKCDEGENEFVTSTMNKQNLLDARNVYRKAHGLLTSSEIVSIREQYGLSQSDLALLLNWGEVTISRYESKAIQDEAYDNILRGIQENPLLAYEYLEKNKSKFNFDKYKAIKNSLETNLDNYGKEFLSRKILEGCYVRYSEPSDYNGNKILSIDVLESVISYFAKRIPNLYKVKLMKMLWYADALSFKLKGYSMTGLVYEHNDMGALPIGHRGILALKNVNVIEEDGFEYTKYHFLPNDALNIAVISADDLDILDQVIAKFKNATNNEVVEYMHQEDAYKGTKHGEIIPFSLAKTIRDFN